MPRLLWRGSLVLPVGDHRVERVDQDDEDTDDKKRKGRSTRQQLDGIAIVARSFSLLPITGSSYKTAITHEDEDDFFSPSSSSSSTVSRKQATAAADAELCLDLEILRNRALRVVHPRVKLVTLSADRDGLHGGPSAATTTTHRTEKVHGRKALKRSIEMLRKGKERAAVDERGEALPVVHLEMPTSLDKIAPMTGTDVQGQERDPESIGSEQDNLTLHIDQRCRKTVRFFNELFCKEPVDPLTGRTRLGLVISLNEDESDSNPFGMPPKNNQNLVVYGKLASHGAVAGNCNGEGLVIKGDLKGPDPRSEQEDQKEEQRQSRAQPVIQLYVTRQQKSKKELGPRPDDPAPRENLFAQKLRRTISQPTMPLFPTPQQQREAKHAHLSTSTVPLKRSASSKQVGDAHRALSRSQSYDVPTNNKARNPFGSRTSDDLGAGGLNPQHSSSSGQSGQSKRPLSTATLTGKRPNAAVESVRSKSASAATAVNPHASPGRRGQKRPRLTVTDDGSDTSSRTGMKAGARRSPSASVGLLTANTLKKLQEEDEDDGAVMDASGASFDDFVVPQNIDDEDDEMLEGTFDRQGSPTPSVATNVSIGKSTHPPFLPPTISAGINTKMAGKVGISSLKPSEGFARSMSMPPGQLFTRAQSVGINGQAGTKRSISRSASLAPPDTIDADGKSTAIEARNKGTVRKAILSEMVHRQHGREHPEFKEVFSMVYKGVQFTFRHTLKHDKLDKDVLASVIKRHLEMYTTATTSPV